MIPSGRGFHGSGALRGTAARGARSTLGAPRNLAVQNFLNLLVPTPSECVATSCGTLAFRGTQFETHWVTRPLPGSRRCSRGLWETSSKPRGLTLLVMLRHRSQWAGGAWAQPLGSPQITAVTRNPCDGLQVPPQTRASCETAFVCGEEIPAPAGHRCRPAGYPSMVVAEA